MTLFWGKMKNEKKMALENENTKQGDGVKYFGRGGRTNHLEEKL